MDAFEPPKYLASLIAAINDGAKSAQAGALAFTLIGLFLVATAFSVTDEDLLLQHTTPISQIGVQLPVLFSFSIAPAAFLFVHVYTLIRYDMLGANLLQFKREIRNSLSLGEDRERCQQLLANVEFLQAWTAARGSAAYSRFYYLVSWSVLAGFPVTTLILVQMSSIRYQSDAVTRTQQLWLILDLALLLWFFYRQRELGRLSEPTLRRQWLRQPLLRLLAAAAILTLDLVYLNVPPGDASPDQVRSTPQWAKAYKQPLDLVLCPTLHFGCRYLRLDHRLLVGHVWSPQAVADLKADHPKEIRISLTGIDGLYLGERNLRFADLEVSRIYSAALLGANLSGANLLGADLSGANLSQARLLGARLLFANLANTSMSKADLSGANLFEANLQDASVIFANLSGTNLFRANFAGTNLQQATLIGPNLRLANLRGANLVLTEMQIANLSGANLLFANLSLAKLHGVGLTGTDLSNTNLFRSELLGAELFLANLSGADLLYANLFLADLSATNLTAARLRGANLLHVNLLGADLSSADLSRAINLTQAQLDAACGNQDTMLPPGLTIRHCPE